MTNTTGNKQTTISEIINHGGFSSVIRIQIPAGYPTMHDIAKRAIDDYRETFIKLAEG